VFLLLYYQNFAGMLPADKHLKNIIKQNEKNNFQKITQT